MKNIVNVLITMALLASIAFTPSVLNAQNMALSKNKTEVPEPARKVKPGLLREPSYKRLDKLYVLIGEEQYLEAHEGLMKLYKKLDRYPYEKAVVAQAIGHVLSAQEKFDDAIKYFIIAIELDALPNTAHYPAMLGLAQLYAAIADWKNTISWVARWLEENPVHTDRAYMLLAQSEAQLEHYQKSITAVKKAIKISEDPKESWYQLWLAMHFELKEYPQAANVLEIMVSKFSDKRMYWSQLSSIYMTMKKDRLALATLAMAYRKGLFEKEVDWKQLYGLYGYLEIPYKAALVLQDGVDKGIVDPSLKNWEQLGGVWYSAHEPKKALAAYAQAAKLADDGKLDMRRAFMYMETDSWKEVIPAIKDALNKGGLKDEGNAHLLLGMAYFETGKLNEAVKSIQKARKFKKTKKSAGQWLSHIRLEQKRREEDSA